MRALFTKEEFLKAVDRENIPTFILRVFKVGMSLILVFIAVALSFLIDEGLYPPGKRWFDLLKSPQERSDLYTEAKRGLEERAFLDKFLIRNTLCPEFREWISSSLEDKGRYVDILLKKGGYLVNESGCYRELPSR